MSWAGVQLCALSWHHQWVWLLLSHVFLVPLLSSGSSLDVEPGTYLPFFSSRQLPEWLLEAVKQEELASEGPA